MDEATRLSDEIKQQDQAEGASDKIARYEIKWWYQGMRSSNGIEVWDWVMVLRYKIEWWYQGTRLRNVIKRWYWGTRSSDEIEWWDQAMRSNDKIKQWDRAIKTAMKLSNESELSHWSSNEIDQKGGCSITRKTKLTVKRLAGGDATQNPNNQKCYTCNFWIYTNKKLKYDE